MGTRQSIAQRKASGFTLVELMVTVAIIGILASVALFALSGAAEEAKVMKTRSMIAKLNNLVMPRYEAYQTRRVPVMNFTSTGGTLNRTQSAQLRLNGLHELMRLEMPDRWTDISDDPVTTYYDATGTQHTLARPAISQACWRAWKNNKDPKTNPPTLAPPSADFQNAETLYLIVTLGFVDDLGGRELFNESNVDDVDQDGAKEFVDGWRKPICFLRWAPGFVSELQPASTADRYQFDPLGVYAAGPVPEVPLYPLIYSSGPDKTRGIAVDFGDSSGPTPIHYASCNPPNSPFIKDSDSKQVGQQMNIDGEKSDQNYEDNGWLDNIHNHLIGSK